MTTQPDVKSKFSHPQKPYSNIHQPPTKELDSTLAIYDFYEKLMKKENQLRDLELRSIHMSIR